MTPRADRLRIRLLNPNEGMYVSVWERGRAKEHAMTDRELRKQCEALLSAIDSGKFSDEVRRAACEGLRPRYPSLP